MANVTIKGITFTLSNTEARELIVQTYGERLYNWPEEAKPFLTVEDRIYIRGFYAGNADGRPTLPNNSDYMRGYKEGRWEAAQDI